MTTALLLLLLSQAAADAAAADDAPASTAAADDAGADDTAAGTAPAADQPAAAEPPETVERPNGETVVDTNPDKPGVQDADGTTVSSGDSAADLDTVWQTVGDLWEGFISRLPFIAIGLVTLFLFYLAGKLARSLIRRFTDNRKGANLGRVLGRLAQWFLIFLGILVAVAIIAPSVTPAKVLSTLGIGGVAIGFAFKDILQNFLAGILILLSQPFRVGDQIRSGEYEGTVESIETRATLIKTYDGKRVVIPNSDIYTRPITVLTHYDVTRAAYTVGIGYADDIAQARDRILSAIASCDDVAKNPSPDVLVDELAGSTVNLTARWWSKSSRADVVKASSDVIEAIKNALDDAQIDMAYPTQVVLFHDQTEETDGDRTRQREGWPAGQNPPQPRPIGTAE